MGEAIMICIDTSSWIMANKKEMFKQQADAIQLYCTKKFQSHDDTVVGICGMGARCIFHLAEPDNVLSLIMRSLDEAAMGGHLRLITSIVKAHTVWFGCWDKELGNHLPKRIAVFAGGRVSEPMADALELGKAMKDRNVAFDAISFGDPATNKQQLFETLIDAADNNGNCNLVLVPPGSTVRDALFRSRIIQGGSAPFATLPVQPQISEENIDRSRVIPHVGGSGPLASSVHQESSKPDKKVAASDPESIDPHDHPAKINALSQSVVDLKLENVKPNSQPETLDQRIERARRELESLIMLKEKQVAC